MKFIKISYIFLVALLASCDGNSSQSSTQSNKPGAVLKTTQVENEGPHTLGGNPVNSASGNALAVDTTNYTLGKDIALAVCIPQTQYVTSQALPFFQNKLMQIVTNYGMGASESSDFVITASVFPVSKDVVPTNPPRVSEKLQCVFYIGDYIRNQTYGNYVMEIDGIGTSETDALLKAIKNIPTKSAELSQFVQGSKQKIMEYYNANYKKIIAEAKSKQASKDYAGAVKILSTIPEACVGFEETLPLYASIHKDRSENEGKKLFQEARSLWTANIAKNATSIQDASSLAEEALSKIAMIDPDCSAQKDAAMLVAEISKKMSSIDRENKEWGMKLKVYQDSVDYKRQIMADKKEIRLAELALCKDADDVAALTRAKNGQAAFSFNLFSLFSGNTLQGSNAMSAE